MKNNCLIIIFLFFIASCSNNAFLSKNLAIKKNIYKGNFDQAISEQNSLYTKKDEVLSYLQLAIIYHYKKDYTKSNEYLEKAKNLSDLLRVKSISEQTFSFLNNDLSISYYANGQEAFLIYFFKALNYIAQKNLEAARIEVRQADNYSKRFKVDSPIIRYLSANIYDALAEYDNALIDYRKAYQMYVKQTGFYSNNIPKQIIEDYFIALLRLNRINELTTINKPAWYNEKQLRLKMKKQNVIFILREFGLQETKQEKSLSIYSIRAGIYIPILLPYYPKGPTFDDKKFFDLYGKKFELHAFYNTNYVAKKELDKVINKIQVKTFARIISKIVTANLLIKNNNNGLTRMILINLLLSSEKADLRSWNLLPAQFYLAKLYVDDDSFIDQNQQSKLGNYYFINYFSSIE